MFDENLVKDAGVIESFLEDELSRKVFRYRLFANLSGDVRYIYQLLKETGIFPFEKAYEMYQELEETYHIFPKPDVISFLKSRKKQREIVLFGAGRDAELYYSLLDAAGMEPAAVIDNYTDKNKFHGIPVYKPESYEKLRESVIVITSRLYADAMYWEMRGRGVTDEQIFVPYENGLWLINTQEYFNTDIWDGRENEIFVDAGAYNLASSCDFIKYAKSYDRIYAFEPEERNYKLCEKKQKELNLKKLELFNAGLWEKDEVLHFMRAGLQGTGSQVTEAGTEEIRVRSLDSVLAGRPCTFIKMDIEGSELMALRGAKDTIKKYRPRLAICLYHKQMDLIEIPLYIKELVPEYKIKMRHYSTNYTDTLLFAYTE